MYMTPPFLAYLGADTNSFWLLQLSVEQCSQYRDILRANWADNTPFSGLWQHIIGTESQDYGLWSTGNAWAAAGMTRVLATILKAPVAQDDQHREWKQQASDDLTNYIREIIDGARRTSLDNGLLRNYLNDDNASQHGFGEISGSSLLAATVYRMAVLRPHIFNDAGSPDGYLLWADQLRDTIFNEHINDDGVARPAVNPLSWQDATPYEWGSPEGNSFVVLMYAAWRDCVHATICLSPTESEETHQRRRYARQFSLL